MQNGDSQIAVRQLPLKQFRAMLVKDDAREAQTHASEAGCLLAEVIVRQKVDLSEMTSEQIDSYRRRYHVPKWQMTSFISACKAAIPFEKSWQYHPD